jgi:hypothetical protein
MIIQLTPAQRSVLEPACAREDLCVFPITAALKGGAVGNVCKSLLKRGLIYELPAADTNTVFRHDESGTPLTLRATPAGKQAIAGEPVADATVQRLFRTSDPMPEWRLSAGCEGSRRSARSCRGA